MKFERFELEVLLTAVRNERDKAEKNYVEALKMEINKNPYSKTEDHLISGVADSLLILQRFNNLILKLENELYGAK